MTKKSNAAAEHKQLCDEIRRHDRLYYVDGKPEISDKEYDGLFQELLELEKAHPEISLKDSPSQRVGGEPVDELKAVTHGEFMLSIDNAYDSEMFEKRWKRWMDALTEKTLHVCFEPKVDGCAVSLIYKNGKLVSAVTRGDGAQGDDILHAARNMRGVPLVLTPPADSVLDFDDTVVEVRGEAYITNDDFKKVCDEMVAAGQEPHKHSRSAAVGALRNLDPKETWRRRVRFVMHGFGTVTDRLLLEDSWWATKSAFHACGMMTLEAGLRRCSFKDASKLVDELREKIAEGVVPADGVVVKLDKFSQRDVVGQGHRAVNWAIAIKKDLYAATTAVEKLGMQVGKQGQITPVCFMKPVEIDGTTVTKATLHNFDIAEEMDIRIGDEILVEKAGKIIPHVLEVRPSLTHNAARVFCRPTACPICGSAVATEGAIVKCTNALACPAQLEGTILAAAARDRLCIDGLGPVLIKALVKGGFVKRFVDLWSLHTKRAKLIKLPGIGEKTVDKLLAELEATKKRTPDKLLCCLNIPTIGRTKSKTLVNTYGSLDELAKCEYEDLRPCVGIVSGQALYDWFRVKANTKLLEEFRQLGFNFGKADPEPKKKITGPLSGKAVCATGSFEHFTRESIHAAIEAAGGKVASSVSKKTAYLVVGKDAGSKAATAEKLGVARLTETEFQRLIGAKK